MTVAVANTHFKCNDLKRWKIEFGEALSIRLHHWITGDPPNFQHTHPWPFLTIVLSGGYDDVGDGRPPDVVRAPALRWRPLTWRHSVTNPLPRTWSIVICGRLVSKWRWWIDGTEVDHDEWNERMC